MTISRLLTVDEFCDISGGISRSHFYRLMKAGNGPRVCRVGKRVFVSPEAVLEWRNRLSQTAHQKRGPRL